jgi:hypothetical protein
VVARAGSDVPTTRSPETKAEFPIPPPPLAPSGVGRPASMAAFAATVPRSTTRPGIAPLRTTTATLGALPPGTSLPPYRIEPRGERVWSVPTAQEVTVEHVANLTLPEGVQGEPLPPDEPPRTASAARLTCTMLARELGRDLHARFGVDLRSDVDGLEVAQRYLREAFPDGRVRTPTEQREVMRHGSYLSELLARRLGARWVDLESGESGRWAMLVPSRGRADELARVWPFARVQRFVAMGHRERDLVSYYLELEGRAR